MSSIGEIMLNILSKTEVSIKINPQDGSKTSEKHQQQPKPQKDEYKQYYHKKKFKKRRNDTDANKELKKN